MAEVHYFPIKSFNIAPPRLKMTSTIFIGKEINILTISYCFRRPVDLYISHKIVDFFPSSEFFTQNKKPNNFGQAPEYTL